MWSLLVTAVLSSLAEAVEAVYLRAGHLSLGPGEKASEEANGPLQPFCETNGVQIWLEENGARDLGFRQHAQEGIADWLADMDQTNVRCIGAHTPPSKGSNDAAPSCRDPAVISQIEKCQADSSTLDFAYQRAIASQVLGACQSNPKVLLIGLGGGTLPMYLRRQCNGTNGIIMAESVELNPDVVFVAENYLGFEQDDHNVVEVADAEAAVSERVAGGPQYDFAVIDCFGADAKVPEPCRSQKLADGIHSILKPGGRVMQNVYGDQEQLVEDVFGKAFGMDNVQVARNHATGAVVMASK